MIGEMSFICLIFAVRPLGGPGQSLGKGVGAKPSNNFFLYRTHPNGDRQGKYRVENVSNHSNVTLNNVILTFSK